MKKTILTAAVFFLAIPQSKACADYYAEGGYFNLFTQSIIRDKAYLPFLHTYESRFYEGPKVKIIDDNIVLWQKYFGNRFTYGETEYLVNHMPMKDLNQYKNGSAANALLKKIGAYGNYREGIDYLIEAKYLEPFMRINYVESPDTFYYRENETAPDATMLHYSRTVSAFTNLYSYTKSPEIKARYGYQLVRFHHYTRNYQAAIDAFKRYVQPLKVKTAPYYLALDQMAGAQRGLKQNQEANWNFFQVFSHSNTRKESAFVSMKLSDSASFNNILQRAQTPEEKNMAYFLLGYDDFTNPLPMMEKMYDIDPDSEILKVMAARSINEIERNYLPTYYPTTEELKEQEKYNTDKTITTAGQPNAQKAQVKEEAEKETVWDRIVGFFKNLFSKDKNEKSASAASENRAEQSDRELLENPNRLPFYVKSSNYAVQANAADFSEGLAEFIEKTKAQSKDEFWQIADAYMKFLKKDYDASNEILAKIQTRNQEYSEQISRLRMLNDITSQPKIDAAFEAQMMQNYPQLFTEITATDSANTVYRKPGTADFIRDILANRYFLQGEDGKSFLMNNRLSDLQYIPNSFLVKKVQEFYQKPDKTEFEKTVLGKSMDDVGDPESFFNIMYGDSEMKLANFEKAKAYYQKVSNFKGIPRYEYEWDETAQTSRPKVYKEGEYNGFSGISSLIFGHNAWESFESPESVTMKGEDTSAFPFIQNTMNKLQLADALTGLKKIAGARDAKAAKANQLIGNVLYNTSSLGYYRHLFVLDLNNGNGGKYDFWTTDRPMPNQYYYKDFTNLNTVKPDNFDLAISYYKSALALTGNREEQARIIFQMASAEQGKYYQWEARQTNTVRYDDPQWELKNQEFQQMLDRNKNERYRTYFAQLKSSYGDTRTAQRLMGSCSYFGYFMAK